MSQNPNQDPNENAFSNVNSDAIENQENQPEEMDFVALREECEAIFKVLSDVTELIKNKQLDPSNSKDERLELVNQFQYQLKQSRVHLKEIHVPENAIVCDLNDVFELVVMWRYTGKPILTAHSQSMLPVTKNNTPASTSAEIDHYIYQSISQEAVFYDGILYLLDQSKITPVSKEEYTKMKASQSAQSSTVQK